MARSEMIQMTIITTTFITVVFRFSYLHSQRGQNSCSFPLIFSAYLGKITESQSLEINHLIRWFFLIIKN